MNSLADIERYAQELNEKFTAKKSWIVEAESKVIGEKISGEIGIVQVDSYGNLVDIRLDGRQIKGMRPEQLGGRIVQAVTAAESKAREVRQIIIDGEER